MKIYSFELYALATLLMFPFLCMLLSGCAMQNIMLVASAFVLLIVIIWINFKGLKLEGEEEIN